MTTLHHQKIPRRKTISIMPIMSLPRIFGLLFSSVACLVPALSHADNLEVIESQYNTIIINESPPYLSMRFGYNTRLYTESVYNTDDPLELPVRYTQLMMSGFSYVDDFAEVLEIGSGGGRFVSYLSSFLEDDVEITTVELDPEVVRLAGKYFGLTERSNLEIRVSDGRLHLLRQATAYDVILVDAYRGPFVPFHLLTQEFYELAESKLNTDGVLVQNVEPSTMLFDAAIATISSVFDHVDVYPAGGNVVVVAYNGDFQETGSLLQRAQQLDSGYDLRYPVSSMLVERRIVEMSQLDGQVLTDDFAPVSYLRSIEQHNRRYEEISR